MDRWQSAELESRFVRWPWCGRAELVSLPHWYWWYFDELVERRQITQDDLHREIAAMFPEPKALWGAIYVYLDRTHARQMQRRIGSVNDNDAYHPDARERRPRTMHERTRLRLNPPQPPALPLIKYSPFKPIARAKRLFPEAEYR